MPFTRISLNHGKSSEYIHAVSEALHQALVEAFDVPPRDKFQAVHQHGPGELVFDRDHLGGPRSEDFILFAVPAGRPRSTATKAAFYNCLVSLLAVSPGIRSEDVMIIINTTSREDWSFSNGVQWT